ncbi:MULTISPECIES: LLM class flavin-dependent oxidoreductase [Streptomyces]|uniref:LLM class flavin-dependent oxidoreductase n=2 Tax=Streptomyces TaxID=1883 RepID=A0ABV9IT12_9ACTN
MPEPTTPRLHSLEFGIALNPEAARFEELVRLAQLADTRGLGLLGVMDHPYLPGVLDSWTLMTVLAARTERIRLFPDVANLPLRLPSMLAKAAASLDLISGGRVELGIGAGAGADQGGGGMGGPSRSPKVAIDALEEAIAVIRRMWAGGDEPAVYEGEHYRLEGVVPGPAPAHPIGVWVGAYGPRMIELTGRLADGWLPSFPYIDPARYIELNKTIDDAAAVADRDPSEVRRLYNIIGHIDPNGSTPFTEGPAAWTERIVHLVVEAGVTGIMLTPMADHERQIEVFSEEVVPAVLEALSKEEGA